MNNNYFDNDECQNNFRRPLPIRPIFCVMQTPTGPTGPTYTLFSESKWYFLTIFLI